MEWLVFYLTAMKESKQSVFSFLQLFGILLLFSSFKYKIYEADL